jgi:hypothetical protein
MTRSVYLIGINHKYQLGPDGLIPVEGPREAFVQFEQFVRQSISDYHVRGIAEEMSLAALKKHFISGDSVPCRIARAVDLPHRYCDPDPEMQKQLSIHSNEQREKYWIRELMSLNVFPVLFVLGANHIDSFQLLLREHGLTPFIVARDWQPSLVV